MKATTYEQLFQALSKLTPEQRKACIQLYDDGDAYIYRIQIRIDNVDTQFDPLFEIVYN